MKGCTLPGICKVIKNLGDKINSHLKNHGIKNMIACNFFINVHMRAASSMGIFFRSRILIK